ncbi:MAG: acetyl-CoA carboxylase biotin carboxyl carrier protein [Alphaproteobacteria bacterium]|nr:acetyl-CoA carboxylase biotin carboxyl carrier protein [Alphaproteobacteria bacterium]
MSNDLDDDLVRRLAGLLDETGLGEIEYAHKDFRIRVARPAVQASHVIQQSAPAPAAPTPAAATPAAPAAEPGELVKSPIVGTVYLAPSPEAAPYVQPGDTVSKGQTLMVVEAMKVMNPIIASRAGKVLRVIVENGQPVEFDQPLLTLE